MCSTQNVYDTRRKIAQVLVMRAPGVVYPLRINAGTKDLRVSFLKLLVQFPKAHDFRGQTKVKSLGQKKYNFHFPG